MNIQLKSFIPEGVCLSCDVCCRFAARKTVWAPFFAYEEIVRLTERGVVPSCLFTHPNFSKESGVQIDLLSAGEMYVCPCFEPAANRCKIYSERPLDCQLYPFLLARRNNEVFCVVDKQCPYVQKVKDSDLTARYVQYLMVFFSTEEFCIFLDKNPGLVQDYGEDVTYVKALPALSAILYGTSTSFLKR